MSNREFLVHIVIEAEDEPAERVDALRAAEAERARELAIAGHIKRLWRLQEGWSNMGLWSASSEAELWTLLDSLPLRRYMQISVRPLDPHPNDPGELSNQRTAPKA